MDIHVGDIWEVTKKETWNQIGDLVIVVDIKEDWVYYGNSIGEATHWDNVSSLDRFLTVYKKVS